MSKFLLVTGAAMLLATSLAAGPATAAEQIQVTAAANGMAVSTDLSARRYHYGYRRYGYRYRPYYGYRYGYNPYYAYAPRPYYYQPYYRPFPFGFFPFY
ncbi:MAG: hypothetical protein ACR2K5_09435 [Pseudolabrys sp.]